jgi:hypothetical protein
MPEFPSVGTGGGGYARSGSASIVAAGAAPQTINYNILPSFHGPVVFSGGQVGLREFFDAMVPMINDAIAMGRISVN